MEFAIKFLQKLNPKNSLFGRILVWFWLAVTLMVVLAFFIARYFSQSWEISALEDAQLERSQIIRDNLQQQLDRNSELNLDRALRRVGGRGRLNLLAINTNTNEFIFGFPPMILSQKDRLLSLKDTHQPIVVRTNNMEIIGPFSITANKTEYQLFVGRLLRREQRPVFAFGLSFFVFLLTGTVACVAIAWTIAKPIKQLSKLSKDFANGTIQESDGESSQLLMNRKDELGQLHNDIYNMASKLAESLDQQKALMANISHELRTPLTRLQLALAMLNPIGEDQLNYAKRIEKDINVMDVLIGQALQLAKLGDESQAQWMQVKTESLSDIINPVLEDLIFEANASDIALQVNNYQDVNLPLVRTSFVSAIENVTRNAIKYSQQNVKVTIELQASTNTTPQFEHIEPMLKITIEDDGKGLTDEQKAHIFEPFYRAPSGMHYQGTGLGLTIARACIELHNGKIIADNSPMGGLCISMLFPLK